MKSLLLLRHAKAVKDRDEVPDFERPLSKRGHKAAPEIGTYLRSQMLIPDLVLSSTAQRAWDTINAAARAGDFTDRVHPEPCLYTADSEECLDILRALPAAIEQVMLVGHNPTLEELLYLLTCQFQHLSTGSVARIALPIAQWAELADDTNGELLSVWRPSRP